MAQNRSDDKTRRPSSSRATSRSKSVGDGGARTVDLTHKKRPAKSISAGVKRGGGAKKMGSNAVPRPKAAAQRLAGAGPKRLVYGLLWVAGFCMIGAVGATNYSQYKKYDAQADAKAQHLHALETQHDNMKRQLSFLQLPKGREQVLLEHGYLKPKQRILLFPSDKHEEADEKKRSGSDAPAKPVVAANTAHTTGNFEKRTATSATLKPAIESEPVSTVRDDNMSDEDAGTSSAWNRAGNTLGKLWNNVRTASGSKVHTNDPDSVRDKAAPVQREKSVAAPAAEETGSSTSPIPQSEAAPNPNATPSDAPSATGNETSSHGF